MAISLSRSEQYLRHTHNDQTGRPAYGGGIHELLLWMILGCGLYLILALVTYAPQDPGWSYSGPSFVLVQNAGGSVGAWCADVSLYLFGYMAFLFPVALIWGTLLTIYQSSIGPYKRVHLLPLRWLGFVLMLATGTVLAELYVHARFIPVPSGPGGVFGQAVAPILMSTFKPLGSVLSVLFLCVIGFTLFSGFSWLTCMEILGGWVMQPLYWLYLPILWLSTLINRRAAETSELKPAESKPIDLVVENPELALTSQSSEQLQDQTVVQPAPLATQPLPETAVSAVTQEVVL